MSVVLKIEPLHISGGKLTAIALRTYSGVPGTVQTLSHLEFIIIFLSEKYITCNFRTGITDFRPTGDQNSVFIKTVGSIVQGLYCNTAILGAELFSGALVKIEPIVSVISLSVLICGHTAGKGKLLPSGNHLSAAGVAVIIVIIHPAGLHNAVSVKVVEGLLQFEPAILL